MDTRTLPQPRNHSQGFGYSSSDQEKIKELEKGHTGEICIFTIKTDVFRALNKLQELTYEGEKVELFQDLAAETISKRRQWRSYTQAL